MFKRLIMMLSNERGEVNSTEKKPTLAEASDEVLAEQAFEEIKAEQENREPKSLIAKPEEEANDDEETQEDSEEPENTDDKSDKDESEEVEKKDDEEKESEEADDKSDKSEEENSDSKDNKSEELSEEKIAKHAEKHGMTIADAKEDLVKTAEILKQFKNDPVEMARAMRNKDREYYKLKQEHEKATKEKKPVLRKLTDDQFRDFARKKIAENDKFITKFKEIFPARAELMSDEAIVEEVAERELIIYKKNVEIKEKELGATAEKKRAELISKMSSSNRHLIPEIKQFLIEAGDETVLDEQFDINDAILWAKGKRYDADLKAAEERGSKRAKEGAEIVGVVKGSSSGGVKPQQKKSFANSLSKGQKEVAEEMFAGDSAEESYKLFMETFSDELSKDKGFIPWR